MRGRSSCWLVEQREMRRQHGRSYSTSVLATWRTAARTDTARATRATPLQLLLLNAHQQPLRPARATRASVNAAVATALTLTCDIERSITDALYDTTHFIPRSADVKWRPCCASTASTKPEPATDVAAVVTCSALPCCILLPVCRSDEFCCSLRVSPDVLSCGGVRLPLPLRASEPSCAFLWRR